MYRFKTVADVSSYVRHASSFSPLERFAFLHTRQLRDAIYNKWGQCFDINFQPVTTFGFRELYLNVMPVCLGSRRFRHETELDYLCHLQAVVSTRTRTRTPTVPRYKNTCLHEFPITGLHGASSVQYQKLHSLTVNVILVGRDFGQI